MKTSFLQFMIYMSALPVFPVVAQNKETDRMENAIQVIKEASVIPDKTIPLYLFEKAEGVAIIPGVIKGALGIGGHWGEGVMAVRTPSRHWSDPCFISLTGGSVGWQVGVESTDLVLIFQTRRSIQGVVNGKFILGADASVAAGAVGRNAEANTDAQLQAEVLSYARGRGLFAGISIQGSALQIENRENRLFYHVSHLKAGTILSGKVKNPPPSVAELRRMLEKLSQEKPAGAADPAGDDSTRVKSPVTKKTTENTW